MTATSSASVTIFCGSNNESAERYKLPAIQLVSSLYKSDFKTLVFGGGNVGLMKIIADTMLSLGGEVIGVITPDVADLDVTYPNIPTLTAPSLAERVRTMLELSVGAITLPGGFGTFFELNWLAIENQFQSYEGEIKPHCLFNLGNYYSGTIIQLDRALKENFITKKHRDQLFISQDPTEIVEHIKHFKSPAPDNAAWWNEKRAENLNKERWFDDLPKMPQLLFSPQKNEPSSSIEPEEKKFLKPSTGSI